MRDLTVDLLNHLFEYDKETGNLIWKKALAKRIKVGDIAGCKCKVSGYITVRINKKSYYAHRLVFLMHKGYLPKTIDHINGDRADNRIENLRAASAQQNQHNRRMSKNNTSGYKGVSWNIVMKKWHAYIYLESKRINLGHYNTPEEADAVVRKAREELHGTFANHGDE
jgi:hypothetical protein